MILRDEKQRLWPVQVGPLGHHFAITRGWRQFREANNVQVGDTYKFELIDNGTIPVAHFYSENALGCYNILQVNILGRMPSIREVIDNVKKQLKIPRGFLKYLKGHEDIEHAVLRRVSKQWQVKVNGRRLEDGWEKFAEEHDLQLGDLLVFRHEGNMEFEVSIFDSSHCDREYSEYLQQEEEEEEANNVEETSKNLEFEERPSPSIELSDHAEAATHKPFGHSSFVCTIKPYCLTYGFLYVPKHFASANGFKTNKKCSLIIKDERQNSWTLRLSCCKTQVYIGDGCRKFVADNCLKEGDRIMFEVVTDGEIPVWKFHVVTDAETPRQKFQKNATEKPEPNIMSSHKVFPDAEACKDVPLGRPHLISTVKLLRKPN
uniref:B3 domain-containing protein REM10-like n=1 Tax=Nicotiana tabacum TaxID=4097 RepID=A0A1S4B7F9_TOBAC